MLQVDFKMLLKTHSQRLSGGMWEITQFKISFLKVPKCINSKLCKLSLRENFLFYFSSLLSQSISHFFSPKRTAGKQPRKIKIGYIGFQQRKRLSKGLQNILENILFSPQGKGVHMKAIYISRTFSTEICNKNGCKCCHKK